MIEAFFPTTWLDQRITPRARVHLPTYAGTYSYDDLHQIVIGDLSAGGASARDIGGLNVGSILRLKLPRIGWRNAELRWVRDGQAGYRFLLPLRDDELRSIIASSPTPDAVPEGPLRGYPLAPPRPANDRHQEDRTVDPASILVGIIAGALVWTLLSLQF